MDKKIKKRWVAALNSGKYGQCTGQLKSGGKYCCLGVLTELYIKSKKIKNAWSDDGDVKLSPKGKFQSEGYLPKQIMEWAGLKEQDPMYKETTLSKLNDGSSEVKKRTFKQIAKIIDKNL